MNILVTGAKGMVGQALVANLKNIRDEKNRTRPTLKIDEIYEYDIDSNEAELGEYCQKADFVFNLAGVNRPKHNAEFMQGNFGFGKTLLNTIKRTGRGNTLLWMANLFQANSINTSTERPEELDK